MRTRRLLFIGLATLALVGIVRMTGVMTTMRNANAQISLQPMTGPTVRIDDIEISLLLPSGPFFLSELLPVDVSLTNHSHASLMLAGARVPSPCGSALGVALDGGQEPRYVLPNRTVHSCPAPEPFAFSPGETLTIHHLLPLTASGRVTLSGVCRFYTTTVNASGERVTTDNSGNFEGRWPSQTITINSNIPADRTFSLLVEASNVYADVPASLRPYLLYLYNVACKDADGKGGSTVTGNYGWEPYPEKDIPEPGCPGVDKQWTVSVSAPGYAIVSGSYKGIFAYPPEMVYSFRGICKNLHFMIGVTAAASAGIYFSRGDIPLLVAAPVALGILLGALIGARLLENISNKLLRILFLVVLIVNALEMILHGVGSSA